MGGTMLLVVASAFGVEEDIAELIRRAEEAKRGRDGCWVVEGHAAWKRGPWDDGPRWGNSSHGESGFTAVLLDGHWESTTLENTNATTRYHGELVDRPLLRQFELRYGSDPMAQSATEYPLLAWSPMYGSGGAMKVGPSPETAWVDRQDQAVTVHWSRSYDDGPGAPAEHDEFARFSSETDTLLAVGLDGQSFSPRRRMPWSSQRTVNRRPAYGFLIEFGATGLPTSERSWSEPAVTQTVSYDSFTPCSHPTVAGTKSEESRVYGAGAIFQDEADLTVAVASAIARERDLDDRINRHRDLRLARSYTTTGLFLMASGGASAACAAWCTEDPFTRGTWTGTAVAFGISGAVMALEGTILRGRVNKAPRADGQGATQK